MRKAWFQWSIFLVVHLILLALPLHARDRQMVAPEEALRHHGQIVTVCGTVAGTQYAGKIKGQPTLLHLVKPYPEHVFTIVIWGTDRGKFEKVPEELYKNRDVCVEGLIVEHNGKPQIVVRDPSRMSVK